MLGQTSVCANESELPQALFLGFFRLSHFESLSDDRLGRQVVTKRIAARDNDGRAVRCTIRYLNLLPFVSFRSIVVILLVYLVSECVCVCVCV